MAPPIYVSDEDIRNIVDRMGAARLRTYRIHEFTDSDGAAQSFELAEIRTVDGRLVARQVVLSKDRASPGISWELISTHSL